MNKDDVDMITDGDDDDNNDNNNRPPGDKYQPCAACKFHSRKCAPDCPLARYFPPGKEQDFLNARKNFDQTWLAGKEIGKDKSQAEKDEIMKMVIDEGSARAAQAAAAAGGAEPNNINNDDVNAAATLGAGSRREVVQNVNQNINEEVVVQEQENSQILGQPNDYRGVLGEGVDVEKLFEDVSDSEEMILGLKSIFCSSSDDEKEDEMEVVAPATYRFPPTNRKRKHESSDDQ